MTQKYYDTINASIAAAPDANTAQTLAVSGWYSIDPKPGASGQLDWNTFYAQRDAYKANLTPENRTILDNYLQSKLTPVEKLYEAAQETLKPYWAAADYIWSKYPLEFKELSDRIYRLEKTDPSQGQAMLKQYPGILKIRNDIGTIRSNMKKVDLKVKVAYDTFYAQ